MATLDTAFAEVGKLVENFRANEKHYLSSTYQEAAIRTDFINKFWKALGWDIDHDSQRNPYEQEVKVEQKADDTSSRRADYAFYLAPNFRDVKFYVEAKKPHGDIATPDNYFQAIRYGWSSGNPLAVLHNFTQFEIVDCRYKPDVETALHRTVKKFHFSDYLDAKKFAEIYWLFSREAVASGSLEKYAADHLQKKRGKAVQRGLFKSGYQSIDDAFLAELDGYRDALARSFKTKNPELDGDTLTELTQRTLDRLVFLRFLEDKQIEPRPLIANFGHKGTAWEDFIAASRRLDGIYNGIVYKKHAILDAPDFAVSDTIFSEICESLCHVNSPYDFNAIPIHILGSIYERFLGKIIVATAKRATVEEKPEVRKAGGVYYTPEYIVRYIVENTVGKLIEGKSPAQIAEMRFADIACGSGSFLLGIYDLLIRWHTKFYNANLNKAKKSDTVQRDDGLHLSLQKKREILLNNIYGVDTDAQAVEVAQLSLYLKLLQDETPGSTRQYFLDFEQQALLPSLSKNIVCGNSLIGTDILSGELFEPVEERKLNPMDFEDRFPHIFRRDYGETRVREMGINYEASYSMSGEEVRREPVNYAKLKSKKTKLPFPRFTGGFDAIVGNPPYLLLQPQNIGAQQLQYLQTHFRVAQYKMDIFHLFIEQALNKTKDRGLVGYITPASFLTNNGTNKLRGELLGKAKILKMIILPDGVFKEASVDNVVFVAEKDCRESARMENELDFVLAKAEKDAFVVRDRIAVQQSDFHKNTGKIFRPMRTHGFSTIAKKLENRSTTFGNIARINFGMQLRDRKKFPTDVLLNPARNKISSKHKKCLGGSDVQVYRTDYSGLYCLFDRVAQSGGCWDEDIQFAKRKVLIRQIGKTPIASLETEGRCCLNALFMAKSLNSNYDEAFLLGLINSKLLQLYWSNKFYDFKDTFPKIKGSYLGELPISKIDFSKPADKARHDKIVSLVEQMLAAKKQLAASLTTKDQDYYENLCASIDRKIDALVYTLYGLTDEEIKIVESATP